MARKLTQIEAKKRMIYKFGDKLDLSDFIYSGWEGLVKYKCLEHNTAEERSWASIFSSTHCCKKAAKESIVKANIKGTSFYINKAKKIHKNKYDYSKFNAVNVFKAESEAESFYKIGVTSNIKRRNNDLNKYSDYKFTLLHMEFDEPEKIYDKELFFKRILKKDSYTPKNKFGGFTECFINLDKAIKYIK